VKDAATTKAQLIPFSGENTTMAQLLAPYNNSMRLGQGFNSYTHQIRLHDAVLIELPKRIGNLDDSSIPGSDTSNSGMVLVPTPKGEKPNDSAPPTTLKGNIQDCVKAEDYFVTSDNPYPPDEVAQIVTYNTRFVDKISDVVGM
jgi:hypothetical protein